MIVRTSRDQSGLLYLTKHWLKKIPGLKAFVGLCRRTKKRLTNRMSLRWKPVNASILNRIEQYCQKNPSIVFIQIGANTGHDQFEALRKRYGWKGVMVEPQQDVFVKLLESNRDFPGIQFENAAISTASGPRALYKLSFTNAEWATNLASFDKNVITRHIRNGWVDECAREDGIVPPKTLEEYLTVEEVQCLEFRDLLTRHAISEIDLVIIDTEGYDFEIVRQLDFKTTPPKLIVFEHKHLSRRDYKRCVQFLRKLTYELYSDGPDTLAVKGSSKDRIGFAENHKL